MKESKIFETNVKINFKDLQVSIMNELIEGIKWRILLEFFYFKFDQNPRKENIAK